VSKHEQRQRVRVTYSYRCGYCGVHETELGSELEQDHYRPASRGGSEDLENLVYCCSTCNRLKSDFWSDSPASEKRILHPLRDDVSEHLREDPTGRLVALTSTGEFHLYRLRLNRPQLIDLRLRRACQRQERARRQRLLQEVRRLQRDQSRLIDLSRRAVEGEDDALLRLREWLDQERKE